MRAFCGGSLRFVHLRRTARPSFILGVVVAFIIGSVAKSQYIFVRRLFFLLFPQNIELLRDFQQFRSLSLSCYKVVRFLYHHRR